MVLRDLCCGQVNVAGLTLLSAMLVLATDQQCGNRVLEDELLLRVGFQHDGVFIKRPYAAGDLCAIQQMHSNVLPRRQGHVEKRFLNVDYGHDSAEN